MDTPTPIEKLLITAGVVIVENGKILLVKRGLEKKTFPGAWTFPGGKMESGESLLDCATRECREEAGVVPFGLLPHSFHELTGENTRTISHLFTAQTKDEVKETDNVRWFSKNDLAKLEIAFGYAELIDSKFLK